MVSSKKTTPTLSRLVVGIGSAVLFFTAGPGCIAVSDEDIEQEDGSLQAQAQPQQGAEARQADEAAWQALLSAPGALDETATGEDSSDEGGASKADDEPDEESHGDDVQEPEPCPWAMPPDDDI